MLNKTIPALVMLLSGIVPFSNAYSVQHHQHQRITPQRYNLYTSDEKKFIWVRVYKVASSTLKHYFQKRVSDLTQERLKAIPKKYDDYFKFAFVRNPWDRIVSCYYNKVLTKKAPDFQECFGKDFDYFVDFINRLDVTKTNSHLKLQTRLIPVDECDFIGKLDNFSQDLQYLCEILGLEFGEIPHKHQTDHVHYSQYYTARTREIIAKKYKEDIETFGFTFETK